MEVTNELGPILDAENEYIKGIKSALSQIPATLSDKSEHDLRLGFRTKALVDLRIQGHLRALEEK